MKQTRKPTSLEWELKHFEWWLLIPDCDVQCKVFPLKGAWAFWIKVKSFTVEERHCFKSPRITKREARKLFNRLFIHGEIFEELRAIETEARKVTGRK